MVACPGAGLGKLGSRRATGPGSPTEVWPTNQPMSSKCAAVRSTLDESPGVLAGSISRLGSASVLQCDTDEPDWNGFGVYTITRPAASAPARCEASIRSVTFSPAPI